MLHKAGASAIRMISPAAYTVITVKSVMLCNRGADSLNAVSFVQCSFFFFSFLDQFWFSSALHACSVQIKSVFGYSFKYQSMAHRFIKARDIHAITSCLITCCILEGFCAHCLRLDEDSITFYICMIIGTILFSVIDTFMILQAALNLAIMFCNH